jgi:hypothetical protein
MLILPNLLHNYEPFSPRVLSFSKMWAGQVWDFPSYSFSASAASWRVNLWLLGFAGLLLVVISAGKWIQPSPIAAQSVMEKVAISHLSRFLWGKLALWLGAVPVMVFLSGIFFALPLNLPVFNLIYVGFIGGYGILLWMLYWRGWMPGTTGKLPFMKETNITTSRQIWLFIGISLLMFLLTGLYARTGWFLVFPFNERFWWLVIFTPVTALGFWIGAHEIRMVQGAAPGKTRYQLAVSFIGLVPFFLYAGFLGLIQSLSGLTGAIQGLLVLWLVLSFGGLIQKIIPRPWLTALLQAILLYWIILPQGVLFR